MTFRAYFRDTNENTKEPKTLKDAIDEILWLRLEKRNE